MHGKSLVLRTVVNKNRLARAFAICESQLTASGKDFFHGSASVLRIILSKRPKPCSAWPASCQTPRALRGNTHNPARIERRDNDSSDSRLPITATFRIRAKVARRCCPHSHMHLFCYFDPKHFERLRQCHLTTGSLSQTISYLPHSTYGLSCFHLPRRYGSFLCWCGH
jgi:hypothetical protein